MRKKIIGLLILLLIYVLAFIVGAISFILLKEYVPLMINLFISDVIATIVIWIVGIFLKTASIYDPYWSVQTVVIYISLMVMFDNYNIGTLLYLSFIMFWAVRLTYNFIKGFNDLSYIDWRYRNIKEKTKSMYQFVSLLGIHLVPTIIVFLASVPSFLYVINNNKFEAINIIGLSIMLFATIIEMIADNNMHTF